MPMQSDFLFPYGTKRKFIFVLNPKKCEVIEKMLQNSHRYLKIFLHSNARFNYISVVTIW